MPTQLCLRKWFRDKLLDHGARSDAAFGYVTAMICSMKATDSDPRARSKDAIKN